MKINKIKHGYATLTASYEEIRNIANGLFIAVKAAEENSDDYTQKDVLEKKKIYTSICVIQDILVNGKLESGTINKLYELQHMKN